MAEEKVKIELSNSEALVLFELVSRFSDDDKLEIQNLAEERVLWNICCQLESILVEPFHNNYGELVANAIKDVLDES